MKSPLVADVCGSISLGKNSSLEITRCVEDVLMEFIFFAEGYQFIWRAPEQHESVKLPFIESCYLFDQRFGKSTADKFFLFFFDQSVAKTSHAFVSTKFEGIDQADRIQVALRGDLQSASFKVKNPLVFFSVLQGVLFVALANDHHLLEGLVAVLHGYLQGDVEASGVSDTADRKVVGGFAAISEMNGIFFVNCQTISAQGIRKGDDSFGRCHLYKGNGHHAGGIVYFSGNPDGGLGQVDQGDEQDGKKDSTILYKATSMVKYQHLLF
ncbi:MAG: hypothetical protein RLZZ45_154, partial [Bacteroidota bacterium]